MTGGIGMAKSVFSLNDDEIKFVFDSKRHGFLSKGMGKSENKIIFLSFDVAKSVIFDNEVVATKRTERLIFMSGQRTHL